MHNNNIMTEGCVWKKIFRFFIPILLAALFQQLYNFMDAVIVGRYAGTIALSAVGGSSSRIIFTYINFFIALGAGATSIIAQDFGAQNYDELKKSIDTAFYLSIIFGIGMTIIGIITANVLLTYMDTPSELMKDSNIYVKIFMSGMIFNSIYNLGSGILRALGDSKRPLYLLIISSFVNIILDIIFVVGFKLGVMGAAIATIISQAISAVFIVIMLSKLDGRYALKINKAKLIIIKFKKMLKIGIPSGCQSLMYSYANIVVQTSINFFSTKSIAAYTAYAKYDDIIYAVLSSFGIALMTYVAQNYGAKKNERIVKGIIQTSIMSLISMIIIALVFTMNAEFLISLISKDTQVITIGAQLIRVVIPMFFTFILLELLSQSLRGLGNSFIPMIITAVCVCGGRLFWIYYVLPSNNTITFLAMCYPFSWGSASISFLIYFIYYWKKINKTIS